jgi:post-GPI attachment to proteins factor 3
LGTLTEHFHIALILRLFLWTCPQECDYTCQHINTDYRLAHNLEDPILQYHGKWPFTRFLGIQEPFSVLFSVFNLLAYQKGIRDVKDLIPASYPMRKYYLLLGYIGTLTWTFSAVFHTRDFPLTETLDYFGAGASVLYGLYLAPIRIFRLDGGGPGNWEVKRQKATLLRFWTGLCISLYIAHVSYLSLWKWDYTYNMAANVTVGLLQNTMWTFFSISRFTKTRKIWSAGPGLIVAWLILAMSMELFDFPPIWGAVDAHSLWHLGTVLPTVWWYAYLIKDAQEDVEGGGDGKRLKA